MSAHRLSLPTCFASFLVFVTFSSLFAQTSWEVQPDPAIPLGEPTGWDGGNVSDPAIFHDGETFWMFYAGRDAELLPASIGVATSPDLFEWTKRGGPVLEQTPLPWDDAEIYGPSVLQPAENEYLMWVGGNDNRVCGTGLAESENLIDWDWVSLEPVLTPVFSWEGPCTDNGTFLRIAGAYRAWYWTGGVPANTWRIGHAISEDGIPIN